jgi:hypothetical protein
VSETLDKCTDYSRGWHRGNYGNAYESQDWETWAERNDYEQRSPACQAGMLLGFFCTYELDEIYDEDLVLGAQRLNLVAEDES